MIGAGVPLTYNIGVTGQGAAQAQVAGLTTTMERSRGAFGAPLNVGGWLRPLAGVRSALSGIGRMALGVLGGMGLGAGIGGFTRLIKESSTFHQDLVSLKATLDLTDEQTAELGKRMEDLAVATGRSRVELLAAARAGTEYGLSIDEVTTNMADLDALARVMKVSPEMLMGGVGGLHKLAGEGVDQGTLRTMLFEGQQASGMREEPFLELVRRMAPQFSGDKRFEGQGGTALFLANIAALGDTMGEDGKKLKSGLKGFLDGLNDTTPKTVKAFKDLGINTSDARVAQTQLIAAVLGGKKGIEDLPTPLRDFLDQIIATDGAVKRLEDSQNGLSGDLTAQGAALQKSLDAIKNEPTWDKLMERFKVPLLNAADSIFTWASDHMPQISAAFQTLGVMLGYAVSMITTLGGAVADAVAWIYEKIGKPIIEVGKGLIEGAQEGGGFVAAINAGLTGQPVVAPKNDTWAAIANSPATIGEPTRDAMEWFMGGSLADYLRGKMGEAGAPVVNVYVDPAVSAGATVRTENASTPTTASPAGVAP